jgi:gentisate 1,2-dioxygenase
MAVTSVASSTTSGALLPQNTGRNGAIIRNTDANILYVLLDGGTASASNHTYALSTGDVLELPDFYDGPVNGVWAADGSGAALVTEF